MFEIILIAMALQQAFINANPLHRWKAYSEITNENWGLMSPNQNPIRNPDSAEEGFYEWPSLNVVYETGRYSLLIIIIIIIIYYMIFISKLLYILYVILDIIIIKSTILKYKKNI